METPLQTASRMVEWSYGTIAANRLNDADWNLKTFFSLYQTNRNAAPMTEQSIWDALSVRANMAYSLLKEKEMFSASSGTLAPFTPTATQARIQEAAAESKRAAELAAAEAARLKLQRYANQGKLQSSEVSTEAREESRNAPNAYMDALKMDLLGIPVWGWALGGIALVFMVRK